MDVDSSGEPSFDSFPPETVRLIAESIGIAKIQDEACTFMASQMTFRLKQLFQELGKFCFHGRRSTLTTEDIDSALIALNIPPIYGFNNSDFVPFRYAAGGGSEIYFRGDKEVELNDIIKQPLPKIPADPQLKVHWLAINGSQPAVPENPLPCSVTEQQMSVVNDKTSTSTAKLPSGRNVRHLPVKTKPIVYHELSVEQQMYFKEITEACVGGDENRRAEALTSLSCDTGLYQLLPRLSIFILEGVRVNTCTMNLALLIYIMRMVRALLDNHSLSLDKYLHELLPAVMTCILSHQLCLKPETDNHWALRDFAARLLASISHQFHTTNNNLQTRIISSLKEGLASESLATLYGAIVALCEFGPNIFQSVVVPSLDSIQTIVKTPQSFKKEAIACDHIKDLLIKHIVRFKISNSLNVEINFFPNEIAKSLAALQSSNKTANPRGGNLTKSVPNAPNVMKKIVVIHGNNSEHSQQPPNEVNSSEPNQVAHNTSFGMHSYVKLN